MREDNIRYAIENLEGGKFERFARELLSREMYTGLNPTSLTSDLGEDARTEVTTLFLHGGLWISLAASKESTWKKIKKDCDRCKSTNRNINVFIFVTAGHPRSSTVEKWKKKVKVSYDWDLVVHTIEFLAPYATRDPFARLVDDYLYIPPPDGDYIQDIEFKFNRQTANFLDQVKNTIPGMTVSLPREEVITVEEQLSQGRFVVLTGEAGTGKSGITAMIARNAISTGKIVLTIDARRIGHIKTEGELRSFIDLRGSLHPAISRAGRYKGCLVIIDQLDNIAGLPSAKLVLELIEDCFRNHDGIEIIVVCRNKEQHERDLLTSILSTGFIELICREINDDDVNYVLNKIGIRSYPPEVIELGRNLLNLELIGQIHVQQPDFDFSTLTDVVYLWEEYVKAWRVREGDMIGDDMLKSATILSKLGLKNPDGMFETDFPQSVALQRLISWGIISPVEGRIYRFRHEKFQDFIYARDAADRLLLPNIILNEILEHKSRNVFGWVEELYKHRNSAMRLKFVQEVFDV